MRHQPGRRAPPQLKQALLNRKLRVFSSSKFRKPCTRSIFEADGINLFAECIKE